MNVTAAGGLTGVAKVIAPVRRRQAVSSAGRLLLGLVGVAGVALAGAAFVARRRGSEDMRRWDSRTMAADAEDDTIDSF